MYRFVAWAARNLAALHIMAGWGPIAIGMGQSRDLVVRQLAIVDALRIRRRGMTVSELVHLTGASRATVYRDLQLLYESGAALVSDRINGEVRHRFMPGALAVGVQAHELAALGLARELLEPIAGVELVDALDRFLRRVAPDREALAAYISLATPPAPPGQRGTLRGIDVAIRNGQRLRFHYLSVRQQESEERCVDPVGLRLYRAQPYLVAFDVDRDDWRVFKVARIHGDLSLDGVAAPRPDYDEARLFRDVAGIWSSTTRMVAVVRLTSEVAARAGEYPLADRQEVTEDPSIPGAVLVRAEVSGVAEALRWIIGFGAAAEALEPAELRNAVAEELKAALSPYGRGVDMGVSTS